MEEDQSSSQGQVPHFSPAGRSQWGQDTFALDTLHVMDEGVISHTLGNVVFDFICKPGWPGTVDQKLKSLFDKVCQQYLEQSIEASHRIKRLVLSSFTNPKSKYEVFPDMSGIKAKQLRWLLPVLYEICMTELGKATDASTNTSWPAFTT